MNPKLIKFAVELQNTENNRSEKKPSVFLNLKGKGFFGFLNPVKIHVNIEKNK